MSNGSKTPGSYWAVAGLGALWNAFGGYLYVASTSGDKSVTEGASPEMLAYIANMPVWAHAGWAFGIWGSVLGSVLMLMRSRYAASAFLVSLIGAVVSYFAQFQANVLTPAQPIMILAVILLLWWFCRRSAAQGIQK